MVAKQDDGLSLPKGRETSEASHELTEEIVHEIGKREKPSLSFL
jgi:hypothetical protein